MNMLFAANWKMHKTTAEARQTAAELVALVSGKLKPGREVMIIPPCTALAPVAEALGNAKGFLLGAQNFYPQKQGAFTGEISPGMLLDVGAGCILVRVTAVLAAIFLVTSLAYNILTKPSNLSDDSLMQQGAAGMSAPAPVQAPAPGGINFEEKTLPVPAPAAGEKK